MKLILGDCLEKLKEIQDNSIDLVLTDPPYGTTACKWDAIIPFDPMWTQLKRVTKKDASICIFGSEPFSSALRMSNIKNFKYDWIWNKVTASGFAIAKVRPMKQHEIISVFCFGKLTYYPQMVKMEKPETYRCYTKSDSSPLKYNDSSKRVRTHKYPKSIIEVSSANKKGNFHPTQKPVPLLEYLIKTYSREGDMVLDFTMGGGSTGVACKNINRNFIGIERDEEYFKICKARIE